MRDFEGIGIGIGKVLGSKMERLAGGINGFSFNYQNFGYRLSTAKIYHVNGIAREKYIPTHYVKQTTIALDKTLKKGRELMTIRLWTKVFGL